MASRLKNAASHLALGAARTAGDPLAVLLSRKAREDPYPIYARLRRKGVATSMFGVFVTATHANVAAVLRDGRFSSSPTHEKSYEAPEYAAGDPRRELLGPETSLLTMDPPDHTRIRRLVVAAFTRRATDGLESFIRGTASRLLDSVSPHEGFDLVDSFAFPLPIAVICHLLGVPVEDEEKFRRWGHDVAMTLEPRMESEPDPRFVTSELALTAYLRQLIARRRGEPDGTLLSALVAAEEEGDRLSEAELVATALLLLVAGFETTVNLISNGTAALLEAPEVWGQLRGEPHRWPEAVEELLRFDGPVQLTSRTATEDVELGGVELRRGSSVVVTIGGANRDPAVFHEPDRLSLDRPTATRHLSFSLGMHHCLGASLARLEARVAFEEITARLERPALAGRPMRRSGLVLRGYESLPIRSLAPSERATPSPV